MDEQKETITMEINTDVDHLLGDNDNILSSSKDVQMEDGVNVKQEPPHQEEQFKNKNNSPSTFCLTCRQQFVQVGDSVDDKAINQGQRFANLCTILRVSIAKSEGWDFDKEVVPLCPSCTELIDRLGKIVEQVANLEAEYFTKTIQLRDKLRNCSGQDQDKEEERVLNFRQLALGIVPSTGSKKTRNASKILSPRTSLSKLVQITSSLDHLLEDNFSSISRIENVLSSAEDKTEGEEVADKGSRSRNKRRKSTSKSIKSTKSTKRRLQNAKIDTFNVESNDASLGFVVEPDIKQESSFEQVFDNHSAKQEPEPEQLDIKQEVDIGPVDNWQEEDPDLDDHDPSIPSPSSPFLSENYKIEDVDDIPLALRLKAPPPPPKRKSRKRKPIAKAETKKNRKSKSKLVPPKNKKSRKVKYKEESSSSESESSEEECVEDPGQDPDFDIEDVKPSKKRTKIAKIKTEDNAESSGDESSSDDDRAGDVSRNKIRKWKIDRKRGKMWYNGIEVILVPDGLQCSICLEVSVGDKSPTHRVKVKAHMMAKHIGDYSCPICKKKLSAQKYLDLHMRMVHEKSSCVLCTVCAKPFTSRNAMRRHGFSHFNEEEKKTALAAGRGGGSNGTEKLVLIKCSTCDKLCRGQYNLKKHEDTHKRPEERRKHMCETCGSIFSENQTLKQHIRIKHENNNQLQWIQCPQCPKKFPQNALLKQHMLVHTGERPHVCDQCGLSFINSNLLKVHIYKHKNYRPHPCQYCDMAFYRNYHLTRHTAAYHLNPNPPKRKLPYRSENGTRKPPQKRIQNKASATKRKKAAADDQITSSSEEDHDMNEGAGGQISVAVPAGPSSSPSSVISNMTVNVDPRAVMGLGNFLPDSLAAAAGNYPPPYGFSNQQQYR